MQNNPELTIIIPFRNEGNELARTLESIRETAGEAVAIVLINDFSDDDYDYEAVAKKHNARYIELYKAIGPARSRDLGVRACETEYFVLMDAHMRLYQKKWQERIIKILASNPNTIICSATNNISDPNTNKNYSGGAYGAYVCFTPGEEYTLKWAEQNTVLNENEDTREIICVLGAFYASTKTHWEIINGLFGLDGYGYDETWISIKTWLSGGKCLNLKNFTTGHLYRSKPPVAPNYEKFYSNQILMNYFFTKDDDQRKIYSDNLKNKIGDTLYEKALQEFNLRKDNILEFKNYFYKKAAKIPIEDFLEINNKVEDSSQNKDNMVK